MPKDRISKSGSDGFMDLSVQWGRDELGPVDAVLRAKVRLMAMAPEGIPGSIEFVPDHSAMGEEMAENWQGCRSCGPVDMWLDRNQINRLIRILRKARDQAYGKDE